MSYAPVYNPVVANTNDGENITLCKILDSQFSGGKGGSIVAATGSSSGNFYALQFVTSGTLSAYTGNLTGTVTGVTFPAGFVLYGTTTAFTTGSGTSVVAYSV
jgi:hypothetical protein